MPLINLDGPWCSVTSSHASSVHLPDKDWPLHIPKVSKAQQWKEGHGVKGRMEPAEVSNCLGSGAMPLTSQIRLIALIVAQIKGVPLDVFAQAVWDNTMRLFYPDIEP